MMLQIKMFFLAPYYRWKTRYLAAKKMQLKSSEEILDKKKDFEVRLLKAQRENDNESFKKYGYYLIVLGWVCNEPTDFGAAGSNHKKTN